MDMQLDDILLKVNSSAGETENNASLNKSLSDNIDKMYTQINKLSSSFYEELSKMYKDQTQMGYSKMLPQIAMGLPQSAVLANAFFENDLLNLVTVFVPPLTSNTMNADALAQQQTGRRRQGISLVTGETGQEGGGAGRPEKPDDQKAEKTIQNIESQS